jgi:hypothetical protein
LKPTVCEESHALVPLNPVFFDAEVFLLLMNGKTDSARFRQNVKENKFTLINCPELGMENEP